MKTVTVTQGQTLYDVAMQQYGSYEGVFVLLADNPSLTLIAELLPGQVLNIQEIVPSLNNSNQTVVIGLGKVVPNSGYRIARPADYAFGDFGKYDYKVAV